MAEPYEEGLGCYEVCRRHNLGRGAGEQVCGVIAGKNPGSLLHPLPVVGVHAGTTILPLFSLDLTGKTIAAEQVEGLGLHVQKAGTDVVKVVEVPLSEGRHVCCCRAAMAVHSHRPRRPSRPGCRK